LIGGGMLAGVRAATGQWMPERPVPGYCAAYLEFTNGTPAVMIQNAYGYFVGEEMVPWGPSLEPRGRQTAERAAARQGLREGSRDELADYRERRVGGAHDAGLGHPGGEREFATDLGIVIVSCERGDVRQSPAGLYVYSDEGIHELVLPLGS